VGDDFVKCRDCTTQIPAGASRCRYCGAAQTKWWETSGFRLALGILVLLIAFVVLRSEAVGCAMWGGPNC